MKIGDFVTGIDQSYVRSIYEIVGFTEIDGEEAIKLVFRAFQNTIAEFPDRITIRPKSDFKVVNETYLAYTKINLKEHFYEKDFIHELPEEVAHKIVTWLLIPKNGQLEMTPIVKSEFDPDGE